MFTEKYLRESGTRTREMGRKVRGVIKRGQKRKVKEYTTNWPGGYEMRNEGVGECKWKDGSC